AMSTSATIAPSMALRTAPPTKRASPSAVITWTVSGAVIQGWRAGSILMPPSCPAHSLSCRAPTAAGTFRTPRNSLPTAAPHKISWRAYSTDAVSQAHDDGSGRAPYLMVTPLIGVEAAAAALPHPRLAAPVG